MIHVIDDWYLDADERVFVLKRNTGSLDKDNNKIYSDYTYHSTVEKALSYLMVKYQRDLTRFEVEIREYLQLCKELNTMFENILKSVKEYEVLSNVEID